MTSDNVALIVGAQGEKIESMRSAVVGKFKLLDKSLQSLNDSVSYLSVRIDALEKEVK